MSDYETPFSILVAPQITIFNFGDFPVHSGQVIQVTCLVSEGDLPLTIEWFKNDERIEQYTDISVVRIGRRSSILSIDSVIHAHAGNYTCKTKNDAGESSYTSQLQVNG